jgi:xanthine dehydrogenase small subunit
MRTSPAHLAIRKAGSVDDALRMLHDAPCMPIAGATDVYVALNFGQRMPERYVDIWALDELREIAMHGDTLVIGALASYTSLIRSPLVTRHLPMLVEAARLVGGVQIQNRGSLGGNIANASPAGDSLPVLAAVDATIVLQSVSGERRIPFTEFFTGYRTTVMRPDELITAVHVPPVPGRQYFRKVGTRAALAISKVVIAAVRDDTPRIAFGSVAPTVVRVRATERALASGAAIDEAMMILASEIAPIDDLRSSAGYRITVAKNLLRRFWNS